MLAEVEKSHFEKRKKLRRPEKLSKFGVETAVITSVSTDLWKSGNRQSPSAAPQKRPPKKIN